MKADNKRQSLNGITVLELVFLIAVIAVIVAISVPNFTTKEDVIRSKRSRVITDMRSYGTALSAYYSDHGSFPAQISMHQFCFGREDQEKLTEISVTGPYTVDPGAGEQRHGLTTPVAYIMSFAKDPFIDTITMRINSSVENAILFQYSTNNEGWILISPGPDQRYNIGPDAIEGSPYDSSNPNLVIMTYDPTNGTFSEGDIWRIGSAKDVKTTNASR